MPTVINGTSVHQHKEYTKITNTEVNDASNVTYTASAVVGGVISRNGQLLNRIDTLPSAADLVAAMKADNPAVTTGTSFRFFIYNAGTGRIDLLAGTGNTLNGLTRVRAGRVMQLALVVINDATGSEECAFYSITNSDIV